MADGLLQHQTAVIKEACLQSALLLKTASFLHFRLPQEPHFIIWDEMGQEKGSRQGRARKHPFVLQSGTCTRLGDLSQAADELVPGGGGGPTAAVQTFFEKHHETHGRPPHACCRLCVATAA